MLGEDAVDLVALKARLADAGLGRPAVRGRAGALRRHAGGRGRRRAVPHDRAAAARRATSPRITGRAPTSTCRLTPALAARGGGDAAGPLAGRQRPQQAEPPGVSAERGEQRLVEGGQVVGVARGDEVAVLDDLLVDPVAARVADVGLQARPRGDAACRTGRRPRRGSTAAWQIAATGLPESTNALMKATGVGVGAQGVGVGDAAGEDEGVVVVDGGVGDGRVDRAGLGLVEVVEELDLAGLAGTAARRCGRRR